MEPLAQHPRKVARRRGVRIDFVGLSLLALTFGPLQVLLDKGEEDDWFQSHFIVAFATIALVAFIVGVIFELYQRDPVVDLRLFKNRNFAASSVLMFALGFLLYATTVLLPEGAIAFLFVPINTVSYAGIKKEQNNQVSSLMNLMRNIGASTGISLTGVMVTERAQFHQAELVQSATNYSPHLHAAIQNLSDLLGLLGSARLMRCIRPHPQTGNRAGARLGRRYASGKSARRRVLFRGKRHKSLSEVVLSPALAGRGHCSSASRCQPRSEAMEDRTFARRCAIYTRKSSEEGLEQDFNSYAGATRGLRVLHQEPAGRGLAPGSGCRCVEGREPFSSREKFGETASFQFERRLSGVLRIVRNLRTRGDFGAVDGEPGSSRTDWRRKMDSNRRSRLFDRKRPVPASFGSLSAPLGAPEADRRRTGF